jgi:hypothetical protein
MRLNELEPQPFAIGDRVLINDDGDGALPHIVMGVRYEHRMLANHGWDIWVVAEDGIESGEGGFDGFSPEDLRRA